MRFLNKNLYDSHIHTPLCKHASGTIDEYAEVALRKNFKGIIITDHNPMEISWNPRVRMEIKELEIYAQRVKQAQRDWKGKLDIQYGIECDYVPGFEKNIERFLAENSFDYILGSIHAPFRDYTSKFYINNDLGFQKQYFEHLVKAAKTGFFSCLSHPDIIKRHSKVKWDLDPLKVSICDSLDKIVDTGIAMEINTSGLIHSMKELYPSDFILKEISVRNIPVILASDAHIPSRVGENFDYVVKKLRSFGFESISYFKEGKREELNLKEIVSVK